MIEIDGRGDCRRGGLGGVGVDGVGVDGGGGVYVCTYG